MDIHAWPVFYPTELQSVNSYLLLESFFLVSSTACYIQAKNTLLEIFCKHLACIELGFRATTWKEWSKSQQKNMYEMEGPDSRVIIIEKRKVLDRLMPDLTFLFKDPGPPDLQMNSMLYIGLLVKCWTSLVISALNYLSYLVWCQELKSQCSASELIESRDWKHAERVKWYLGQNKVAVRRKLLNLFDRANSSLLSLPAAWQGIKN